MVHRGIASLSGALMVCFLLLSYFEPSFFLLHLYQSLIYLIIILMLFYFEDHWAYMLGMMAPAAWLLLTYGVGKLGGVLAHLARLLHVATPYEVKADAVTLLAVLTAVLSVVMIISCAYRWKREYAGMGRGWRTFATSLLIVVVYYGVLVLWFWNSIPRG